MKNIKAVRWPFILLPSYYLNTGKSLYRFQLIRFIVVSCDMVATDRVYYKITHARESAHIHTLKCTYKQPARYKAIFRMFLVLLSLSVLLALFRQFLNRSSHFVSIYFTVELNPVAINSDFKWRYVNSIDLIK